MTRGANFSGYEKVFICNDFAGGAVAFTSCEKENKDEEITSVTDAAGNVYKVVKLADGNYWMAENLRYIPEGKTVSEDPTTGDIWYPVNSETKALDKTDESVKKFGLLYTPAAAFNVTAINKDNCNTFEGVQGICPNGWHIPTAIEFVNLTGKTKENTEKGHEIKINENAYYYNKEAKIGSIEKINKDGFNITKDYGFLYNSKVTATMSYILGSTLWYSTGTKEPGPKLNEDGSLNTAKYYSLMIWHNSVKNGETTIVDKLETALVGNHTVGVPVRCVKDKIAE